MKTLLDVVDQAILECTEIPSQQLDTLRAFNRYCFVLLAHGVLHISQQKL